MYFFNCTPYHWRYLPHRWLLIASCLTIIQVDAFHIILDPAGDAKNTGRQLATCYERSITLQLCEVLKENILKQHPTCTVTITRTTGETRSQEQRAQMANQLNANLFVHISCFEDTSLKPHVMLYYMSSNNLLYTPPAYTLIPAHKGPDIALPNTKKFIRSMYTNLSKQTFYTILNPYAIPDTRLASIMVPALTIEFGISRTMSWTSLIEPLSNTLILCIQEQA